MRVIAFVLVGLTACGAGDALLGKDCTSQDDQSWDIDQPDQATAFRIEQCRIDGDACTPLCNLEMQIHGVQSTAGATGCEVTFDGGSTHVKATYTVFNNSGNCAVPEGF